MSKALSKALRVGVVVPTRNRPGDVVRAVGSILESDYPDFELVVVDQSDDARTQAALDPLTSDPRVRVRKMNRVGVAAARNLGCAELETDVVAFTDDDCEVAADWIRVLVEVLARDAQIGLVFGSVEAGPYDKSSGFVMSYQVRDFRVVRNIWNKTKVEGIAGCMAVRRAAWEALGGFDEGLGAGAPFRSAEETDLTVRALIAGYSVCETPAAVVYHHGFRAWNQGDEMVAGYMFGLGAVHAKALRLANVQGVAPLAALGWRWLAGQPVADLNHRPSKSLRLGAFVRGFVAGQRTRLNAATGHFRVD